MMIYLPHIILAGVAIFFLGQTIVRFVRGGAPYAPIKFFVTFGVWGGVLFFALFPDFARVLSQFLHIGENLNTLIFIGFVIIFMFIFRLLRIIEKLESDITALVRVHAIEEKENSKNKEL